MEEIYLTVKAVSELRGCTERYIRTLIGSNKIYAIEVTGQATGQGGVQYRIPLSTLDSKLQLKYKRSLRKKEKMPNAFEQKPEPELFNVEEITASQREEIEMWKKILDDWQKFRSSETNKAEADESFITLINVQRPELKLTRRTLYRKWKAFNEKGAGALLDKRGRHNNHNKKLTDDVWDIFEYYYLDESRKNVSLCLNLTQLCLENQGKNDLLPLPSPDTFERRVKKIPEPYIEYFRNGRKAFLDKCAPYIKRVYEDLEANDIWVADNHTFDIMVTYDEKPIRIYLTAFLDVRSRKMMGWCVTDAPCSDATIYALRRGIEKYGIPKMIYTDNGREFLFHDFGGNGFRRKKKSNEEFKPPTILDKLQIEFRTALPQNARAKIIERSFRTVKENFSRLFEAYTGGSVAERPERLKKVVKNPDKLTLVNDFMKYVDAYLYGDYNKRKHTGEGMYGKSPDEVFAETLFEKRVASIEDLNLMLMRYSNLMQVKRNGVSLKFYGKELQYWTDDLLLNHFGEKVYVRYAPDDLSKVRIYDKTDVFICEAPLATQLSYLASKEEIAKAQKENRSYERLVSGYKKKNEIKTDEELDLIMNKAMENIEAGEDINPKVLRLIKPDEPYKKAVGYNDYDEVPIDWTAALQKEKAKKFNADLSSF